MDLLGSDATALALGKGLLFASARQNLIAANIANVNTPGYRRRDLDVAAFESRMASALGLADAAPGKPSLDELGAIAPEELRQDRLFYRTDLGGVDIDREMAELAKASLQGAALGQLLQKRISAYRLVIREGR